MILILLGALFAVSLVLFLMKRNGETALILGLCVTLSLEWTGVLAYIAKKGGIAQDMQTLLFLTPQIRRSLQYLLITLGQLGYWVALGRYLYPLMLMWLSLYYAVEPALCRRWRLNACACAFPALSLIVYYPVVFEALIDCFHWILPAVVGASLAWTLAYILLSFFLLIREYRATSMAFYRHQFRKKCLMLLSLSVLYVLYCPQDPAQVYLFYRNEYMGMTQGLWYLSPALSTTNYLLVFALVIICAGTGFATLLRYAQDFLREDREEMSIQRKFDVAGTGASVFVHSIKNQLLANRVLHKRIAQAMSSPQPDMEKLRIWQQSLMQTNETMLARIEELYQGVKSKSIMLMPTPVERVCRAAAERFSQKYPDGRLEINVPGDINVLCDETHLAEALYNLLVNAWEAQLSAGEENRPVTVACHQERLYTVLEVKDCGGGIPASQRRRIFEPFYSNKNTNYNWGMGLSYVRTIVKSHLGMLRMDSREGCGSSFYIQLPKYEAKERGQNGDTRAGSRGL